MVGIKDIINIFEGEITELNMGFFYCLRNSLRARGKDLQLDDLVGVSPFLKGLSDNCVTLLPGEYIKSIKFDEDEKFLSLSVDRLDNILPEDIGDKFQGDSSLVDDFFLNILAELFYRYARKQIIKPFKFILGNLYSNSHIFYFKTVSSLVKIPSLRSKVSLELINKKVNLFSDIDLREFIWKSSWLGQLGVLPIQEKLDIAKDMFPVGSIVQLTERVFRRNLLNKDMSIVGSIKKSSIIQITGYNNSTIHYNLLNCYETSAERIKKWYQISEEFRDYYSDLICLGCEPISRTLNLYETAIGYNVSNEDIFLLNVFNKKEKVEKEFIGRGGEVHRFSLTAPEAVFLLLKENKVEFNEALFLDMYEIDFIDSKLELLGL